MKKNLMELVFILDRSGSMAGLEKDTIGGFNGLIEKQRREEGECNITTTLFDNHCEFLHDRIPVAGISRMTEREYYVRGTTALMDAIGISIEKMINIQRHTLESERAAKVMFVIITDGMENASRRFNRTRVRRMIEEQRIKYGWEFLFLGANIDAEETAARFGIDAECAVDYCPDSMGTELNYRVVSETVSAVRCCGKMPGAWKQQIREDFKNRGGR